MVPINPLLGPFADNTNTSISDDGLEDEIRKGDDELTTWHDVALSIAAELMEKIRGEVRTQLGYTTSAVRSVVHLY